MEGLSYSRGETLGAMQPTATSNESGGNQVAAERVRVGRWGMRRGRGEKPLRMRILVSTCIPAPRTVTAADGRRGAG